SLTATTSTSLSRSPSTIALRMLRPMRPKPLIATRTAILAVPYRELEGKRVLQLRRDGFNNRFGRNAEVVVKRICGRAGAEILHADEAAVVAQKLVPAHGDAGLDGDLGLRVANDLARIFFGLLREKFHRGNGDDLSRNAAFAQQFQAFDGDRDLRAGGEDCRVCIGVAGDDIGAAGAQVLAAVFGAQ